MLSLTIICYSSDKITAATSSQFSPADLGLELTENSHEVEMEKRISKAKVLYIILL